MGFREEIEKLRVPMSPKEGWKFWGGENAPMNYGIHREKTNKTLDDVLAILDEWKLVVEHQFTSGVLQELDIFDGPCPPNEAKTIEFSPRDRIAIYVRRREDGS